MLRATDSVLQPLSPSCSDASRKGSQLHDKSRLCPSQFSRGRHVVKMTVLQTKANEG